MRESKIEQAFILACKKEGYLTCKLTGGIGIPDRMVLYQGRVGFAEIKREGANLRAVQEHYAIKLREAGFYCEPIIGRQNIEIWIVNFKKAIYEHTFTI